MRMRWQPSLQIIPHYESEPLYINALVNSSKLKISEISWTPDLILASYRILKNILIRRSVSLCCQKTTRLISEKFKDIKIETTFQSRFGPEAWLQPYADKTIEELPKKGKKNLLIICPDFHLTV